MAWKDKTKDKAYRKAYSKKYYQEHKQQLKKCASEHYYKNKGKKKRYAKKYREEHKEEDFEWRIKRNFGLSKDDWNILFSKQSGCCAICGKHQKDLRRKLGIDHNHSTGQIRGLLCNPCNAAIGSLRADSGIELLQKAIEYIKDYSKV